MSKLSDMMDALAPATDSEGYAITQRRYDMMLEVVKEVAQGYSTTTSEKAQAILEGQNVITVVDMLWVAKGCVDYNGGYSGDEYIAFQAGITTVSNALLKLYQQGLTTDTRVLRYIGKSL